MPTVEATPSVDAYRSVWIYDVASAQSQKATPPTLNIWNAAWSSENSLIGLCSDFPGEDNWYVSTVRRQTGLAVAYEPSGPVRAVDSAIGIHVYRVLQEALSNVTRHSGADRAWVRLRFGDDRLELTVEDHGAGMRADTKRAGLGIVGMRERAALVGGSIEFTVPPEGGTTVRLTVPLPRHDAGQAEVARAG